VTPTSLLFSTFITRIFSLDSQLCFFFKLASFSLKKCPYLYINSDQTICFKVYHGRCFRWPSRPYSSRQYDDMTSSSFICSNCAEEEATLICEQLKTLFCDQCSQSFSFCIPCRSLLDFTVLLFECFFNSKLKYSTINY
jgi:hypothetical protein